MKTIFTMIAILILGLGISGQKKDVIPDTAKFTEDAVWETKAYGSGNNSVAFRYATGTKNGVKYRYYTDGSGSLDGEPGRGLDELTADSLDRKWSVKCTKDAIDDSKTCVLNRGLGLFVFMRADGNLNISVGASHDTGSDIAIRVDENPAYVTAQRAGFNDVKTREIIEAIKKGKSVVTRYDEFAKGRKDATFSTYGFAEAMEFLKWALTQIK